MENEKHIKNWINYKQLYAYRPLNPVFYTKGRTIRKVMGGVGDF